ncbi:hypothetical protein KAU11_09560 [Candidatus Babeliales bacterium]|nr:hypothetical protein [Candidatus Babeliales bacterium]
MEITVRITNGFGHKRVYPVCDKALLFAKIAGRTCLAQDDDNAVLDAIKQLGFTVTVQAETL